MRSLFRPFEQTLYTLPSLLPWALFIAPPGVILNADGSLQQTFAFRGRDLISAGEAEHTARVMQTNRALMRFGSGWAFWVDMQRREAAAYPTSKWQHRGAGLIDLERREIFLARGAHYECDYHFTATYLPPNDTSNRLRKLFYDNMPDSQFDLDGHVQFFMRELTHFASLLDGVLASITPLNRDETATYLHSTVSTSRQVVRLPETPTLFLNTLLADQPLRAGLYPKLGDTHLRTLTLHHFPEMSHSDMLDDLNHLDFPYRWTSRLIPLDKAEGLRELRKFTRRWFGGRQSLGSMLYEIFTGEKSARENLDAINKGLDAEEAEQEVAGDQVMVGYLTATVTTWDEDEQIADQKIRALEKIVNNHGFLCHLETLNAVEAWLGSLPGQSYANVRRPLMSSINMIHLMPLSAVWAGPEHNDHLKAPVLTYASTAEGSTPFRLSLHVGDVGHTLVTGPTGSGKSALLAFLSAQFLRYENAQVFYFDKGGSATAITHAVGGVHYDLRTDAQTISFQPLARIDESQAERAWATEWILDLLTQQGIQITPRVQELVRSALLNLASAPSPQHTLSGLMGEIQDLGLQDALKTFTMGGTYGLLLDSEHDSLRESHFQCFEMEDLMQSERALCPTLAYLFHRIQERCTGVPTLCVLDEAFAYLAHEVFAKQLREWLKTLRKSNASVMLATQSIADITQSLISTDVLESCTTRIYCPNPRALEPLDAEHYQNFGLAPQHIHTIATATPKRHYFYQSVHGVRLFDLRLDAIALACCGASRKSDHDLIAKLVAQHGQVGFLEAYLNECGLAEKAHQLEEFTDV